MENYQLLSQIGEGSFGRVFKARRKYTGRLVAIKMVAKKDLHDDDLTAFKREVDILKRVNHPHIMRQLETFETETDFCIVSELGRGDLFQVIEDNQTLPENIMRSIAAQLVSALSYLHGKKIIHRDLKPQNVLVSADGALKLCDFGFARALSRTTLVLNSVKGTPLYMAPELVQEHSYNEQIDVWSLGIILYELYFGQPPYYTDALFKLVKMIINDPVTFPRPISDDFRNFLEQCLQKDPEKRAKCEDLCKHPFVSIVDLSRFDDTLYYEKKDEFEDALKNQEFFLTSPIDFNVQDVVENPAKHTSQELGNAISFLSQIENMHENSLVNSFLKNAHYFILDPKVAQSTLSYIDKIIDKEIIKNDELLSQSAESLLNSKINKFNKEILLFIVKVLIIPGSMLRCEENFTPPINIEQEFAQHSRDHIFSSLFTEDITELEYLYSLLVYLAQTSDTFLECLTSSGFVSQSIPIFTMSFIRSPSILVTMCSLSLICIILDKSIDDFDFIKPLPDFIERFLSIFNDDKLNIEKFVLLNLSCEFCSLTLSKLVNQPEFNNRITNFSAKSNVKNLVHHLMKDRHDAFLDIAFNLASTRPKTIHEKLACNSLRGSFFSYISLTDFDQYKFDISLEKFPRLLAKHQIGLLSNILSLPKNFVFEKLPNMVDLLSEPYCSDVLCSFILENMDSFTKDNLLKLCSSGMLSALCKFIKKYGPSPESILLIGETILRFEQPNKAIKELCSEIISTLFSVSWSHELAFIVATHYSRFGKEFISQLECYLSEAEEALRSTNGFLKNRAILFLGNLWKNGGSKLEYMSRVVPILVETLKEEPPLCASAAFAIGNAIYHVSEVATFILSLGDAIKLLASEDIKSSENSSLLLTNLIKKNEAFLTLVLKNGSILDYICKCCATEDGCCRMLPLIYTIAQYDEGKSCLRGSKIIDQLTNIIQSSQDSVKKELSSLISIIRGGK